MIIGIAGPSCAGKTELTLALSRAVEASVVLPIDAYYRDLSSISFEERTRRDFDSPEIIEHELLIEHVRRLALGETIERPVYAFDTHSRLEQTERVVPGHVTIVEGIFALYWEPLRAHLDLKLFVTAPAELCLERRLDRDVRERGRSPESVRDQFERTVWPGAEKYVLPTRQFADLMLLGTQPIEESVRTVLERISW